MVILREHDSPELLLQELLRFACQTKRASSGNAMCNLGSRSARIQNPSRRHSPHRCNVTQLHCAFFPGTACTALRQVLLPNPDVDTEIYQDPGSNHRSRSLQRSSPWPGSVCRGGADLLALQPPRCPPTIPQLGGRDVGSRNSNNTSSNNNKKN